MIEVQRRVRTSPDQVWAVLADGWNYVSWVVGTSRMRAVHEQWPAQGSTLHHSAGLWPALLNDETQVLRVVPGRRLELIARGRPFGEAAVTITIEPDGDECIVRLTEDVASGVARVAPGPVRQVLIAPRNRETLRRLAYLAERRTAPKGPEGSRTESASWSQH